MTFKNWLRNVFGPRVQGSRAGRRDRSRQASRARFMPRLDLLEDRLAPATLVVNSSADNAAPADQLLTLREAILSVNQGSLMDSSASNQVTGSFGSNDTIRFASSLDGDVISL